MSEEHLAKKVWIGVVLIVFAASLCSFYFSLKSHSLFLWLIFIKMIIFLCVLFVAEAVRITYEYFPSKIKMVANFIGALDYELFCLIATLFLYPFDLTKKNPRGSILGTPIILVHGYLGYSSLFRLLRSRLLKAGIQSIYTINLGRPFDSIETYTSILEKELNKIQAKRYILVGHSMGGIVCASFAATHPERVERVIAMGSPIDGSFFGLLGIGKASKQMRYHSKFVQELQQKIANIPQVPFYFGRAYGDLIIMPNESAAPRKIEKHMCVENFPMIGHLAYLYSERVGAWLISILR